MSQIMPNLKIHFLNVGHGDCTIIEFPDRLTVVDINACKKFAAESETELRKRYRSQYLANPFLAGGSLASMLAGDEQHVKTMLAADSAKLIDPVSYITTHFPGQAIFRYIQTHPDMDHMAGLYRLIQEKRIEIVNFWDTRHIIEKDETAMRGANVNFDIKDWHIYQQIRKGKTDTKVLFLAAGDQGHYYSEDGITVWAPWSHDAQNDPNADPNDLSYVLHVQFQQCSILLGGDLSEARWEQLYAGWKGRFPKINLLKPSHHGRKSGYHRPSVQAMAPDVSVVSVGDLKKKHDATASYEALCKEGCFSTVDHGTIIATCWADGDVWLQDANGKNICKTMKEGATSASSSALAGLGR